MKRILILIFVFFLLCIGISVEAAKKGSVELPSVIEIVGKAGDEVSDFRLRSFCKEQHLPATSIYKWKNHLVLYARFSKQNVYNRIKVLYPWAAVRYYKTPFYVFDRTHCNDKKVAKEWENILLTANLVKDTLLQKEYLQYHATQYQEWPEVSNGFCNADFQQLLVFRSGRQLMLVISIPKGRSLDELNPKTTENNPRVDEWNRRMAKYQEGLPEAMPGEVWSFLKPIKE
ncbi:L-rhamnose mutarotase [Parabacteroides sp. FAFU027]|uniref:L-rhamnose mutarotase n=1 Tax=Parabacteroides sp. FAFU027 TaxID=2922715 RepID=UPI001FAFFAE3|nr:L-rhamnose mutarotase [Parabacteroides sp. FAFU027]